MADRSRLEDLRRLVEKDPASIAFAQLAEEYRRAGEYQEAVECCRAGLAIHPDYQLARVTLGRALAQLGELVDAQRELEAVVASAPENLAAIRALAGIHRSRGAPSEALDHYRAALALAPNDPAVELAVKELNDPGPRPSEPSGRVPDPAAAVTAARTIAVLDQWLAAIHVTRAQRRS